MKRLKGMKTQNKKMLVIAVSAIVLLAGFSLNPVTVAAEGDEELDLLLYLNPFDLTTTSYSIRQDNAIEILGGIDEDGGIEDIAIPDKIWIPVRPTFRSPCLPSW